MHYIGRFAPSPSGDLHFGSLVTAIGSYLQAKSQHGTWLVRIEDIDPPREIAGASKRILSVLESFGLYWDDQVLYQSDCHERYREIIHQLLTSHHAYYCDCTRQRIQSLGGFYDQHCRNLHLTPDTSSQPLAIRYLQNNPVYQFSDKLRGLQQVNKKLAEEDFVILRRDGLFAYNLAVVLDDHYQGVTEIVRGADLLEPTVRQIAFFRHFQWKVPDFIHLPLALNSDGSKLSKQNHALPVSGQPVVQTLGRVLEFLNQSLPENWQDGTKEQLLDWAIKHWDLTRVPKQDQYLTTNL
ncbi:tRNA glutamyl-Q(34) synthetase GluQRS [Zophobihabitans entericus]|uniref:Glutamyl-Q tRNA(Asp) synthetase n=1 Tax=Zophobihabitans entericus TaxID=1635327 RepID=A0A6G9I9E9_9GAMM|nr:tRNA glutamyl-Q(34) synthetase GluQRS [Zophobihabitans entericus]QIQ20843.1 tRNA glutamyl-Q(34) synthetase GluQRS [Zophobihabitans entericus]